MLKDKQIVMGLKIYEKEAIQNKYIKAGKKKGFLGNDVMHARTGLCTHEFNLRVQARSCIHRSLPRDLN